VNLGGTQNAERLTQGKKEQSNGTIADSDSSFSIG
jgi:hypothetical protein